MTKQPTGPEHTPLAEDLNPDRIALFLDFDGVLAPIAPTPDAVQVGQSVIRDLARLDRLTCGHVVIVSGRPLSDLDRFLSPLRLAGAGVHGLEMRTGDGTLHEGAFDEAVHREVAGAVDDFADRRPGLLSEIKRGSVALHYRARPQLEGECLRLAENLASKHPALETVRGKMVVEMRLGGRTKGDAVAFFMNLPGFSGRLPIFVGDDVTDEDGFAAATKLGGRGYKVGPGQTIATHRFADIEAFRQWLARLAGMPADASPRAACTA